MELVDKDGQLLQEGLYEILELYGDGNPHIFYFHQNERGDWMSRDSDGDVVPVHASNPEITKDGVGADARFFSRVPVEKAVKYVKVMKSHAEEVQRKIGFLEEVIKKQVPVQSAPN